MLRCPKHHAGTRFDLHVVQRFKLNPREVADLLLCEADVVDVLRVQAVVAVVDLFAAQAEGNRRPAVELLRIPANGLVAVLRNVTQYALDRRLDARIALILQPGGHAFLQVSNHFVLSKTRLAKGAFTDRTEAQP